MAHIAAEGEVNEKRACVVPTRPRASARAQPVRVREATTEKRALTKKQPYEPRKPQTRGRARENKPVRHNFEGFDSCAQHSREVEDAAQD